MPVHDWSRVSAGVFHDFHNTWIVELKNALNAGVLPPEYYAMSARRAGFVEGDVLKLSMLAIRHTSDHRIIALVEIVSPENKDSRGALYDFVQKAVAAIDCGHHLLVVDLHSPGSNDPDGIHGPIWSEIASAPYVAPTDLPLTLAAYMAGPRLEAYVEPFAIAMALPDMPLFLDADRYVSVPLERTYESAFRGVPEVWRQVLEADGS